MGDKDRETRPFRLIRGGGGETDGTEKDVPQLILPGDRGTSSERGRFSRRLDSGWFQVLSDLFRTVQKESGDCPVLEEICREFGGMSCQVYLWDEEAQKLVLSYDLGPSSARVQCRREFALGEGYPGWAALNGSPVIIRDLLDPDAYLCFDLVPSHQGFYAAIPLIASDTLLGVLQVVSLEEPPAHLWSPDLLAFVGRLLALHLERDVLRQQAGRETVAAYALSDHLLTELTLFLDARPIGQWDPEAEDRVAALTLAVARRLGWEVPEWRELRWLCRLRDIGMLVVAPEVLHQPGPLTPKQKEAVRRHPEVAYQFFQRLPVSQESLDLVRHHHERFDGRGYPDGLAGEEIPRLARAAAVADAYNSMVSPRPYRPQRTPRQAMQEIERCAGSQFDPEVAEACLEILDKALRRGG